MVTLKLSRIGRKGITLNNSKTKNQLYSNPELPNLSPTILVNGFNIE